MCVTFVSLGTSSHNFSPVKIKSARITRESFATDTRFRVRRARFDVAMPDVVMLRTVNFRHDIDSNFSPAVASQLFPNVLYDSGSFSFFPLKTTDV